MYNKNSSSEHKGLGPPSVSPRISFSNDFVESSSSSHTHAHTQMRSGYRDAPVSSDFEFSVSNYSMMSADELFFKGRLLPLKEGCSNSSSGKTQKSNVTTLRDELQNNDEDGSNNNDDMSFSLRPPKNPNNRWKGFLGLRKSHIGSKKADNSNNRSVEKRVGYDQREDEDDDVQCSN